MLTVYGATGYTGKLISDRLTEQNVPFTIAGRSAEKLNALRDAISSRGKPAPELVVAGLGDREALEALARRSRVILHCAGPFAQFGPPMIDACLRGGAHYLDVTGEARFMVATALRDSEAKNAKVALVNAVGFDVVPSDLALHLATRALGNGGPPDDVELALALGGGKPSAGTMRTVLTMLREPSLRYEDGRFVEEPIAASKKRFDFPELGPRDAWNAPIGDVATAPRTTGAKRVRAYLKIPSVLARTMHVALPRAQTILKTPISDWMSRVLPAPGEGPAEGDRRRARFSIVAEARRGASIGRATVAGRDGYGITAECAVAIAIRMMEKSYDKTGALSPMTALDPEIWRALLEKLGCTITTGA